MQFSGLQYGFGITANGSAQGVHSQFSGTIGTPVSVATYPVDPNIVYSLALQIAYGATLTLDTATGAVTGTIAGANQVETATAGGTITASGNATVTITSPLVTGSPLAVSVAVTNTDTAATWAGKVRTALAAVSAIASHYTVGGSSAAITLTATVKAANDTALNIALANDTCTGVTAAATSANTTAGVATSMAYRVEGAVWDARDAEGVTLANASVLYSILVKSESSGSPLVSWSDGTWAVTQIAPFIDLTISPDGNHRSTGGVLAFTATSGNILLTLDIHAGT